MEGCTLRDITWHVPDGSLVAVVGKCPMSSLYLDIESQLFVYILGTVGSGKSSLLSSLLGDMIRVKGEANIKGKIAYVPQQAWMQNTSLKNNILFGRKYKKELYEKVRALF